MLPQPVRSKNAQCPYGSPLRCAGCVAGPDQWRAASLSQWYKLSADCVAHPPHKCQTPDASALLRHDSETLPSGNPVPIHKPVNPPGPRQVSAAEQILMNADRAPGLATAAEQVTKREMKFGGFRVEFGDFNKSIDGLIVLLT